MSLQDIDPIVYATFGFLGVAVLAALGYFLLVEADSINAKLTGLGSLASSVALAKFAAAVAA
jgi:hypothetical protein